MKQKPNLYLLYTLLSVLILSIFINICYFNVLDITWENEPFRDLVTVFGAIIAFCFALYQYAIIHQKNKNDFLKLSIENKNNTIIKTTIENSSIEDKAIEFACLIITDYVDGESNLIKTINDLKSESRPSIKCTNDLIHWKKSDISYSTDNQKQFIPIPFYYKENIGIGNEHLQYEIPLPIDKLSKGNYSVRFFVFSKEAHLHRSTHCILTIN
mgnify:CR=1 FL=1